MKLRSKKSKAPIIIGVVVGVIVLLAIIAGIVLMALSNSTNPENKNGEDIESISISSLPDKTIYYVGEEFDPAGTKIQVLTYDMAYTSFVGHGSLTFSGFDSSTPAEEQVITVSYKGFTTTFTIEVKEVPSGAPDVQGIEVFDFKTTTTLNDWNEYGPAPLVRGATIKIVYADGSTSDPIYLMSEWLYGWQKVSQPGTFDLTIKYNHDGVLYEKVITITITE